MSYCRKEETSVEIDKQNKNATNSPECNRREAFQDMATDEETTDNNSDTNYREDEVEILK